MTDESPFPGGSPLVPDAAHTLAQAAAPRRIRWWLWPLTLVLLGGVVAMQRPAPMDAARAAALKSGTRVDPPGISQYVVIGKLLLGVKEMFPQDGSLGGPLDATVLTNATEMAEETEIAEDRFRVAILAGEVSGEQELRDRLKKLEESLAAESPLRADIETVLAAYDGRGADSDADRAARKAMEERHGWFARLALENAERAVATKAAGASPPGAGAPAAPIASGPARQEGVNQGLKLIALFFVVGMGMGMALLAGLIVGIVGLVLLTQGRLLPRGREALEPGADGTPGPNPGLWLETLAVFLAGFMLLKVCAAVAADIGGKQAAWPVWVVLLGQWLLAPLVLWPRLRGLSREEFRRQFGLHTGRGLFREIGAGLLGYLATVPVYMGMAVVVVIWTLIQQAISGHKAAPIPENRVLELAGGGPAELVAIALLVSVWAPLVEETLFRGVVYRFFRGTGAVRVGRVLLAALGSAVVFAVMHGYVVQGLLMVGTLGMCFALMREWRGSLVPSMTAHCVHNTWVLIVMIVVASMAKG